MDGFQYGWWGAVGAWMHGWTEGGREGGREMIMVMINGRIDGDAGGTLRNVRTREKLKVKGQFCWQPFHWLYSCRNTAF